MWGPGDVRFFDRLAPFYEFIHPNLATEAVLDAVTSIEDPIECVLDIGGGPARILTDIEAATRVVIDPSRGMLKRAPPPIERVRGMGETLPIRERTVDVALLTDVLHHVDEQEQLLAEAARTLAVGGRIIVADIDPTTAIGRTVWGLERLLGMDSTFLTPEALADQLRSVGLEASVQKTGAFYVVVGERR